MEMVFRPFPPKAPPAPAPGELHLRPQPQWQQYSRSLATLALEQGPDAFVSGAGPVQRLVVQADPTLDDMLATTLIVLRLDGHELPAGMRALVRYATLAREGLRPSAMPPAESLAGMYLAVRNLAGDDLTEPVAAARFVAAWRRLEAHLLRLAEVGADPFTTVLFAQGEEFARERAFLADDLKVYRQDLAAGERWLVQVPGRPEPMAGLLLCRPRSILWKDWARSDAAAPGGQGYAFLAVFEEDRHWRFSTDPVYRLPIRGLCDKLQKAEAARDAQRAAEDTWFDGASFGHTLVGAPRKGTLLSDREVLRIVKRWARTRRYSPGSKGRSLRAVAIPLCAVAVAVALAGFSWLTKKQNSPPAVTAVVDGQPAERGMIVRDDPGSRRCSAQLDVMMKPGVTPVTFSVPQRVSQPVRLRALCRPKGDNPKADNRVERISVDVNGETSFDVPAPAGAKSVESPELECFFHGGQRPNVVTVTVEVPPGPPLEATVRLTWGLGPSSPPDLYLLAVGVSRYASFRPLDVADKDAQAIVGVFKEQQGRLFHRVVIDPALRGGAMTDERAVKADILDRLAWLQETCGPHSLVLVTLSGHGLRTRNDRFFFLPHDFNDLRQPAATALSWDDFRQYLAGMPCPVIVVMDTCHSGAIHQSGLRGDDPDPDMEQAVAEAMAKLAKSEHGIAVMAACLSKESASESKAWGHGALTLAVLETVGGKRLFDEKRETALPQEDKGKRIITLEDLDDYARKRVGELTNKSQAVVTKTTGGMFTGHIPITLNPAALGKAP